MREETRFCPNCRYTGPCTTCPNCVRATLPGVTHREEGASAPDLHEEFRNWCLEVKGVDPDVISTRDAQQLACDWVAATTEYSVLLSDKAKSIVIHELGNLADVLHRQAAILRERYDLPAPDIREAADYISELRKKLQREEAC